MTWRCTVAPVVGKLESCFFKHFHLGDKKYLLKFGYSYMPQRRSELFQAHFSELKSTVTLWSRLLFLRITCGCLSDISPYPCFSWEQHWFRITYWWEHRVSPSEKGRGSNLVNKRSGHKSRVPPIPVGVCFTPHLLFLPAGVLWIEGEKNKQRLGVFHV